MTKGSRVNSFSCQSFMPVAAGTPNCENPEVWLGTANWHVGFCYAPPRPQRGTSPRTTGFWLSPERRNEGPRMPEWGPRVDVRGGIALGVLSRDVSAWIPAFAGMTNGGVRWRTRKPFERIFVPIAHAGWRRHTKA